MLSGSGKAEVGTSAGGTPLQVPRSRRNSKPGGSYVVKSGDTLAGISRRTNVPIDALKSANNLSGSTIRVGQTLVLPNGAVRPGQGRAGRRSRRPPCRSTAGAEARAGEGRHGAPKAERQEPAPKSYTPPAGKEDNVASAQSNTKVASLTPESSGIGKLRWPARGQVVASFGSSEDGHRNDGIDISVPEGTPVKAAENGVVIYSGNGLKEYGNTVLIRHDDGLVTVYGYAKDLKVKRGDKVTRGEVIADSGMSGEAEPSEAAFRGPQGRDTGQPDVLSRLRLATAGNFRGGFRATPQPPFAAGDGQTRACSLRSFRTGPKQGLSLRSPFSR